jgi:hypothetical protein
VTITKPNTSRFRHAVDTTNHISTDIYLNPRNFSLQIRALRSLGGKLLAMTGLQLLILRQQPYHRRGPVVEDQRRVPQLFL